MKISGGTHMITNDILYIGVNDRDIDLLKDSMLSLKEFPTIPT